MRAAIVVLNYQRCEALRRTLAAARRQRGPVHEVIVVDNGSTDGSVEMVRRDFPDVHLIALDRNEGTAARNVGVAAARADIVVTLDNDVLLTTAEDVARAVDAFARYPRAAVVDFMVLGPDGRLSRRDWCHPRDADRWAEAEFPTSCVLEGASACRRAAFLAVGGYWPPLFLGHEGVDLALRLINAGWEVRYTPAVRVQHLVAPAARPAERIYYTFTRNAVWVALRNLPAGAAVSAVAQDLALMALCAARAGQLGAFVRGVRDAVAGTPAALATRRPLSRAARAHLRAVRAHRPGLLARVWRHLRERLI